MKATTVLKNTTSRKAYKIALYRMVEDDHRALPSERKHYNRSDRSWKAHRDTQYHSA